MQRTTNAKPTLSERLSYDLDRWLSAHAASRFLLLGLVALASIFFCAILISVIEGMPIHSAIWWALIRVIDTAAFGGEERYGASLVAFVSSISGMVVVASLIGT